METLSRCCPPYPFPCSGSILVLRAADMWAGHLCSFADATPTWVLVLTGSGAAVTALVYIGRAFTFRGEVSRIIRSHMCARHVCHPSHCCCCPALAAAVFVSSQACEHVLFSPRLCSAHLP